jgi:hypothetical protein
MLNYHLNGWLNEDAPLQLDWEAFLHEFVFNERRNQIFEEYEAWLAELKGLGIGAFFQWVDGRFISRKPLPNDLDVVSFIPYQQFEKHESKLRTLSKRFRNIDSYWVKDYPIVHSKSFVTAFDKTEWRHLFRPTV